MASGSFHERKVHLPHLFWVLALLCLLTKFTGLAQQPPPSTQPPRTDLRTLTRVRDLIDLGMEGARTNPYPISIRGVVTHIAQPWTNWIYVQDDSGGTLTVYRSLEGKLADGAEVEVRGVAAVGDFHTFIQQADVRVVGSRPFPNPATTPAHGLASGEDFAQWVRVRAVVRNVARDKDGMVLLAAANGVLFLSFVDDKDGVLDENWLDAEVEVDGLNWTQHDSNGRPQRFRLHVPSTNQIRVVRPGSRQLFQRPLSSARELEGLTAASDGRVRIRGRVVGVDSALGLFVLHTDDGPVRLQLLPSLSARYFAGNAARLDPDFRELRPPAVLPSPGDSIEAVGAPDPEPPFSPRLKSAEWRSIGREEDPAALPIRIAEGRLPANDGRLVRIRARFVDRTMLAYGSTNILQLWLQADAEVFEARLENVAATNLNLAEGALVEATGVCLPVFGELRKPRGMRLLLRSTKDLQPAQDTVSWLSDRVLKILLVVAAVAAAGLIWIGLLHRQVSRQTETIRASESRLRQTEQHFRTVFQSSPVLMALTRLDNGRFVAVNDAFLKSTGFNEPEVVGHLAQDLNIYANPAQRLEFVNLLRRDRTVRDREHVVRRKDGSTFTALVSGDIIDIDGEPHTLTVGLDITSRKKAEEDTLRALAAERELGELKSRFVSLVSHEFRTPLGITMSAVELLRNYLDRLPAAKRTELLDDIYSATLRMSDLMEQVLLLGRVEAGKVAFHPVPTDLVEFASRIVDETLSATQHRCPVTVTACREAAHAVADEVLLRPILSNLLSNAIKYSPDGSPVRILLDREGSKAVFTVVDHGIGIPPEDHPRLYEAFHRASNVEHISGTGLGLLIVRRCVDLHEGEIQFTSTVGQGTTFTVRIPAFPAAGKGSDG